VLGGRVEEVYHFDDRGGVSVKVVVGCLDYLEDQGRLCTKS
jgi:hypothetical protein